MSEETSANAETLKGVVKWFNDAKGFGFIEHTSGKDVFVHYSVIDSSGFKTLKDGEDVLYEIKEGPKGLHAVGVRRVNEPASEESNVQSADKQDDESTAQPRRAGSLAAQIVQEVVPSTPLTEEVSTPGDTAESDTSDSLRQ